MRSACPSIVGIVPLVLLVAACVDPTNAHPRTAEFVLRSVGGVEVPATILIADAPYVVVADTLFVDSPRAADGAGVLRRSIADTHLHATPELRHGVHNYFWRDPELSVFFDCEAGQPCLAIFTYRQGTISGRELRFPASGPFAPERLYERVR